MNKTMKTFALMLLVACASCKHKMTVKDFDEHESKIFSGYCTNDIRAAERILLDGLETVSRYESNHIEGIDFNAVKALYHERLFLIYRNAHETNQMAFEFKKSLECIAQSRREQGESPPPSMTYDEFAQKLDWRERGANVRWKTNAEGK